MKKTLSILLALVFLSGSVGMTIYSHYCGSKLESVGLIADDCCCRSEKSSAPMKDDCCNNKLQYIKITDTYSPSSETQIEKIEFTAAFIFPISTALLTADRTEVFLNTHSPPPKFSDPVIYFRTLLI